MSYNGAFTATRQIHTPWPIVVGQLVLSIILILTECGTIARPATKLGTKSTIVWMVNMVRVLGSIGWTLRNILNQTSSLPSSGVVVMCMHLLITSVGSIGLGHDFTRLASYAGVASSIIGLVLYIVGGFYCFKYDGYQSILLVTTIGCVNYFDNLFQLICTQLTPMQQITQSTNGDEAAVIAWGIGVFWTVLVFLGFLVWFCRRTNEASADFRAYGYGIFIFLTFLGIAGAITASVLQSTAYTSTQTLDCRNTTFEPDQGGYSGCVWANITLQGSKWGFWNQWSESKIAILNSIFVW